MRTLGRLETSTSTHESPCVVFTIGHSTRPIEAFVELLHAHQVRQLLDIRTIPGSRRHPHFGRDALSESLGTAGIAYRHLPGLGGLRRPAPDSVNMAWRNASFRGYADYMQTPEFDMHLQQAIDLAQQLRSALMCAEVVPWRCHRSLVADAITARGLTVCEISSPTTATPHTLTSWARVEHGRVTYPATT